MYSDVAVASEKDFTFDPKSRIDFDLYMLGTSWSHQRFNWHTHFIPALATVESSWTQSISQMCFRIKTFRGDFLPWFALIELLLSGICCSFLKLWSHLASNYMKMCSWHSVHSFWCFVWTDMKPRLSVSLLRVPCTFVDYNVSFTITNSKSTYIAFESQSKVR